MEQLNIFDESLQKPVPVVVLPKAVVIPSTQSIERLKTTTARDTTFSKSTLTPRQEKLRNFFYAKSDKKYRNEEERISAYEYWLLENGYSCEKYTYHYFDDLKNGRERNNMTSIRQMRKDLRKLRMSDDVQKIITTNGYAHSVEEANDHLDGIWSHIIAELDVYHKECKKLKINGQQRLTFGKERSEIQAILTD